jgi:hypothetical protein
MRSKIVTKKIITDRHTLISWLADQVKTSGPQTPVSNGIVALFDDLVSLYQEGPDLMQPGSLWPDVLREMLLIASGNSDTQVTNSRLVFVIAEVYGESIQSQGDVGLEFFVRELIAAAGLLDAFEFVHDGGSLRVNSTVALAARTKKRFRVTLQPARQIRLPR